MQSFTRQLKRGNAVIVFSEVMKRFERVSKRGTEASMWRSAEKNALTQAADDQRNGVVKPQIGKVGRKASWATDTRKKLNAARKEALAL